MLFRSEEKKEGENWANDNGCLYWEMSAKNNDNTSGLLYFIGNNIFNNWDEQSKVAGISPNVIKDNMELTRERGNNIFKSCCRIS